MASERFRRCLAHLVCLVCVLASVMTFSSPHKVKRSVGGTSSAAGSFPETVDGQATVKTKHGAQVAVLQHGRERQAEKQIEQNDKKDLAIIRQQLKEAGLMDEDTAEHPLRRRRSLSRRKRFMTKNRRYVWPKGIVPYDFNMTALGEFYRDEALAAFTRWHKYTCIRFVPWVPGATMEKHGLTEESHVTITRGRGCAAHQGNIHSAKGQYNSCCKRSTCTHELGHTLGLWHEHQSPWREDIIKLDRSKVSGDMEWTYKMKALNLDDIEIYQYDTSNTMHYGGSAFPSMYEDLSPLIKFSNQYYMYKDVSLYHKCEELHCGNFTGECHNGAFLTLVDNECSCLCPPGLDARTDCATTITQVDTSPQWPDDAFALFSSTAGCPAGDSVFASGAWQHQGAGNNRKQRREFHLAGSFEADVFRYQFCVKTQTSDHPHNDTAKMLEPGRYCILRVGGVCPAGFQPGYIQFDDAPGNTGQAAGDLPDGLFVDNGDTRLEYCCRDDGFTSTPLIRLPNTHPFVLLQTPDSKTCQEVSGMRWTEEYMWFDSFAENATMGGSHPYVSTDTTFKLWFCHYVPVDFNCGAEISLTKSTPQTVITSPNYPQAYGINMECNWIIKAGKMDGQVLLNFDEMKVKSSGNDCEDSLEIRYNLPGQPGIRFCGDGLGRTIRSLNDTVILTLRTDHHKVATDIGFNVTASLYLPEEDMCYDPATRGSVYRGEKNYTRGMKPCIPWTEVTHCLYHAFHPRDFGSGLDENYCRNPDNTAMPWCYTDAECSRDYCDVCNIERLYDRSASCPSAVCEETEQAIVNTGCAVTCGLQHPPTPARDVECSYPGKPADASFVGTTHSFGTFPVGGTVSLQCNTGSERLNMTCLTDGQWSLSGYVCGACADGWAFFNGSCYQYFPVGKTFHEARDICGSYGAQVSSMKNEMEMKFVSSLRLHFWNLWVGATDTEVEGEFRWEDGTLVDWFNWDTDNTPNNYRNQDCVEAYTDYFDVFWNDIDCEKRFSFVCKYSLSERTVCFDRHPGCAAQLLTRPELCSQQPDYADQMCAYSCGLCQADANPEDSNDVELIARPNKVSRGYTYTSLGSSLGITRDGVIKQWTFYSPQAGLTFFQVWRPQPQAGNYSMTLVGQSQVLTSGIGEETYDLDEADWIRVQSGDRIGLYEVGNSRGLVPYTYCDSDERPEDFGVTKAVDYISCSDFSPSMTFQFSSDLNCRTFSFKAVIHPVDSVPANPDLATSQVSRVTRSSVGSKVKVYLGDSVNFYVPADGYVTEWQFFAKYGGTGAFQVWRKRADRGEGKFELIGQNNVNITSDEPRVYTIEVPVGERIAVKAGDIIGFLYGQNELGLPYSLCKTGYNDSSNIHSFASLTPETAFVGDVYSFKPSGGSYACRVFSFRSIVEQAQVTAPATSSGLLRTSDIALVSRGSVGISLKVFLGESPYFSIPADGYVTEWQFFAKYGGTGAFQVWRRRQEYGERKFQLIGQNEVNVISDEQRPYTLSIPEGERIAAKAGDIIGFLYGEDRLGLPYSVCSEDQDYQNSNNISRFKPLTAETAFIGDIYPFSYSGGVYSCRVFSFRAIVQPAQVPSEPPLSGLLRTSDIALVTRSFSRGSKDKLYVGNSSYFSIPADGFVTEWQFFAKYGGAGAFQVWRRRDELGLRKFEFVGQNEVNLTSNEARPYTLPVPAGKRIAVKAGDVIGFLYLGDNRLSLPYSLCSDDREKEMSNNVAWLGVSEPLVTEQVYSFSYSSGSYLCRVFSFRAVIEPAT